MPKLNLVKRCTIGYPIFEEIINKVIESPSKSSNEETTFLEIYIINFIVLGRL